MALSRTCAQLRLYYVGARCGSPVPRTIAMKYLLMMQFPLKDWKTSRIDLWPPEDIKTHMAFLNRFNQELIDAGEFVRTEGLAGPEKFKVVRAKADGSPAVNDGPFAESKEVLAGYWAIDVEVHPVMFSKGDDM